MIFMATSVEQVSTELWVAMWSMSTHCVKNNSCALVGVGVKLHIQLMMCGNGSLLQLLKYDVLYKLNSFVDKPIWFLVINSNFCCLIVLCVNSFVSCFPQSR